MPVAGASIQKLLDAKLTTGAGSTFALTPPVHMGNKRGNQFVCQAIVAGTGAVSATVLVQVSCDDTNWLDLLTITLSGTTSAADGDSAEAPWPYIRGNVSAISGTGAAVTLYLAM